MKNQLIQIYLLVCQTYDNNCSLKYPRLSNFKPKFTDEEIITIYLFGQLNEKFNRRQIYDFIHDYWSAWFPPIPSYQAFNRRLNLLTDNFQLLFGHLLKNLQQHRKDSLTDDFLIDSMPIMLAQGSRSKQARVATDIAECGFSAVKQTNFHGVRLHLIGNRQIGSLPLPSQVWIKESNFHDLVTLKEVKDELPESIFLPIKIMLTKSLKDELRFRNIKLLTSLKKPKKKELSKTEKHFNKLVSSIRQPIEGFFKWLIDKTDIQRASQVHSIEGLIIHCLGKLTFALLLLNLYY